MSVSIDGHVTRFDAERIETDWPLSVDVVRHAVTGASHLVDQYTQPRINIAGPNPRKWGVEDLFFSSVVASYAVPWRIRPDRTLYRPIVRVGASIENADLQVLAVLRWGRIDIVSLEGGEFTISGGALWHAQNEITTGGAQWVIDEDAEISRGASSWAAAAAPRRDGVLILRFDIHFLPKNPTGTPAAKLHGVYLREYAGED